MNYDDELDRARSRRSHRRPEPEPVPVRSRREYDDGPAVTHRRSTQSTHESRSRREGGSAEFHSEYRGPRVNQSQKGSQGSTQHGTQRSHSAGSSSPHSKGNHRRRKSDQKKKLMITIAVGILVFLLVVVVAVLGFLRHNFSKLTEGIDFQVDEVQNTAISQDLRDKMEKGYWTVAVFGVDSRDNSLGAGNQSDVIMIVNLNRKTGQINLVSVFRDSYLNINDKNTYNKINAAYAAGGPEQAVKALNKNLDLNITHYATFNWKAVATAINILGGIDVDISKSEFYYINAFITETVKGTGIGSVQLDHAGMNHLDGVQAVAYARLRLMDTDYARTERQRLVVSKAFEKAKAADLATLNSLVGNMFAMVKTNINEYDILGMVKDVKKYHLGDTMGFPSARNEMKIKIGSRQAACVIPQTLESNVKSLHKFLFGEEDYQPSQTCLSISNKISEISGLHSAGKEIGHVATDQGYIPKETTQAAPEPTAESETETSTETTSATEESTEESQTDEFGNIIVPESSSEDLEEVPGEGPGGEILPPKETVPRETMPDGRPRPSSPEDMRTEATTEGFGPGHVDELINGNKPGQNKPGTVPEPEKPGPAPSSGSTEGPQAVPGGPGNTPGPEGPSPAKPGPAQP